MITLIVPSYNQGEYLNEALDSILVQSYKEWECIIVNDGSSDITEKVALSYCESDQRFKYVSSPNKGVSSARNIGISLARFEYILPLDADDKIAPIYLERAISAFNANPELALVYGEAEYFGDKYGKWIMPDYNYYGLLLVNNIYCSAIFKKSDFIKAGGYSEDLIYGLEDWDLWIRLLDETSVVCKLKDTVFYYRIKSESRNANLTKSKKVEYTRRQMLQKNKDIYGMYMFTILKDLYETKKKYLELQNYNEFRKQGGLHKLKEKLISFLK